MYRLLLALVMALGVLIVGGDQGGTALAATITVCPSGPPRCDYSSIQAAIDAAQSGDTIHVRPATYNENLIIGAATATPLTLKGNGATVDGRSLAASVLDVKTGHSVTIEGLTFTHGKAKTGGGIHNEGGTVALSDCRIDDNTATGAMKAGGGISNELDSAMTVRDCRIDDNHATGSNGRGGGIINAGTLTLKNTLVSNNTAVRGGGIANNTGANTATNPASITLSDSPITGNIATDGAGGMSNGGNASLRNSPIRDNTGGEVGGVGNGNAGFTMTLTNSPVTDNVATATSYSCAAGAFGIAGGIGNADGSSLSLMNSPVTGNRAPVMTGSAGGINNQSNCPPAPPSSNGTVTRENSPVKGNTSPQCLPTSLC